MLMWVLRRQWGVLLLVVGVYPFVAHAAEPVTYTSVQRQVEAGAYAHTIQQARAFLRQVSHGVERAQVLWWLAEALYATRAYHEAALAYRSVLQEAPTFPDTATVLRHLGLSEFYSRQYNAAVATFTRLLEQFPGVEERERIVLDTAAIYVAQGRFDEALPLYQQLQQGGRLPALMAFLHLQLGHCYFYLQQFELAQQHYHTVIEHFSDRPEAPLAHYQLGAVALAQQEFETAQQHFQTMLHVYPPGPATVQAHYGITWTLSYQGQIEQAVTYLEQHKLLAVPSEADSVLARGYDLVRSHAYDKAIALLTHALTQSHDEAQAQPLLWLLTEAYEGAGDAPRALQTLDDFMHRFPQTVHTSAVHLWRGDLLQQTHDPSETLAAYRAALAIMQDEAQAEELWLRMAELYKRHHALDDALATWQRVLQIFPWSPRGLDVQLRMGATLVQQGAVVSAVALYQRLLSHEADPAVRVRIRLQLAWAYLRGGEYDRALELYDALVGEVDDAEKLRHIRFWRGWMLQRQEQYEASNREWHAWLAVEPTDWRRGEVLWRLGANLLALGQYDKARQALLEVVTSYAEELYARFAMWQLQRCFLALRQYREAFQHTVAFSHQGPLTFFRAAEQFTEGKRLFDAKHYRQARRQFQRLVDQPIVTPLADDAAFFIAESYRIEGDLRRALAYYQVVTQRYGPTNITAWALYRQGRLLHEAGNLSEAAAALRQAVQQTTQAEIRERAWYHLGKIAMQLQQPDEAIAMFQRLVQAGSSVFTNAAERVHLGLLLQQLGDYTTALRVFHQVFEQSTDPRIRAEAYFWAAETYQLRGDTATALAAYRQVASQFPAQADWAVTAWFRAGEMYEVLQQYADAIAMYQRVAAANPENQQGRFAAERIKFLKAKIANSTAQPG